MTFSKPIRGVIALHALGTATLIATMTHYPWVITIGAVVAWLVWPDPPQVTVVQRVDANGTTTQETPAGESDPKVNGSVPPRQEPWMLTYHSGSVYIVCQGKCVRNQQDLRKVLGSEATVGAATGFNDLTAILRVGQSVVDEHNRTIGYPPESTTS